MLHGDPQLMTSHGDPQWTTTSHGDPQWTTTFNGDPQWTTTTSHGDPQWTTTFNGDPQWTTTFHSDPQQTTTTSHGDPQWTTTTSHGDPQWTTTSHGDPQLTTTAHGDPQWTTTTSHGDPQWTTTFHGDPQWTTTSHGDRQWTTMSHGDPQWTTTSHGDPQWTTSQAGPTQWTREENLRLQRSLVYPESLTDSEAIARLIPGKTPADVEAQFEKLVSELEDIYAGRVPFPKYTDTVLTDRWNAAKKGTQIAVVGRENSDRKIGTRWTEDEHKGFLLGLEKLGKGEWKNISKYFVPSRDSTQVASHAQKYFNRLNDVNNERKRSSIHDIRV